MAQVFPTLRTHRLVLRQLVPADQMQVYLALSDRQVIKYYGVEYHSYNDTAVQMAWYEELFKTKTGLWWALTLPDRKELIGACGINNWQAAHQKAELGFWLLPEYWRLGYMAEALRTALPYLFNELPLHRIEAYVETENPASSNLLRQLGFTHEGTLQDCEWKKDKFISLHIFARVQPQDSHSQPT